jgi:hypothetical protein
MLHAAASWRVAMRTALLPLAVAAAQSCTSAPRAPHECGVDGLVVNAVRRADVQPACAAGAEAIAFLVGFGLEAPAGVHVDIVPRLFDGVRPTAVGIYRETDGHVQILSYDEFRKHGTWFNLPIDHTLYRALVAHEVAHAVAARNFKVPSPTIQAKEYIAYVTMLSTMPGEARDKVLSEFSAAAFEGEWQMQTAIYLADPMQFGVRAYRHFVAQRDARAFLKDVLAGKALGGG